MRDDFRAAGWSDQELWALSYNGLGGNSGTALRTANPERDAEHTEMGWDGQVRITDNEVNVPDLYDFISAVRTYTGSPRFVLVAHSLGVTLARRTLKVHPELRSDLVAFVGIAGGNHGTSLCPPGSEGNVVSCDEIAAGTKWLADLNGAGGSDETYGPARWMTIYDGSGAGDPAYAGPSYASSPALKGADNRTFPGTYHNDLRVDPAIVAVYRAFVSSAETAGATAVAGGGEAGVALSSESPASQSSAPDAVATGAVAPESSFASLPAVGGDAASPAPASPPAPVAAPDASAVSSAPVVAASVGRRLGGPRSAGAVWACAMLFLLGVALLGVDQRQRLRPAIRRLMGGTVLSR